MCRSLLQFVRDAFTLGQLDVELPTAREKQQRPVMKVASRNGILAGGNWIIDQVKIIDAYPARDHLANIRSQSQGTGGSPYNVLVDLANLQASFPLMAAGLVGNDDLGRTILQDCRQRKIDLKYLRATPLAPTSYTDVMTESSDGHRTFFHHRGANALWDGHDLNFAKIKAKIFHLGYLLLLDALDAPDAKFGTKAARLLKMASDAGLKTSVDVVSEDSNRFASIVSPALKHVDYCILNEIEAGKTTGFTIRGADGKLNTVSLRHAAGALLQHGVKDLVVIHFPEGAFARTRKGEDVWQSSLKLPSKHIAGTAGAGDAFAAGVLLGLHEGWALQKSLFTGVCVAAASLSHPTCTGGVKSLSASVKLARKYPPGAPIERA
ncbi:MAG: carbohydrate kinase family protein [Limisphaerales bacterium]